jgi:hypothetical protein
MGRPFNAQTLRLECTTLCFAVLSLKKCAGCLQVKPREEFSDHKNRPDGKYSYCRECRSVQYKATSEVQMAKQMEHYWKNRDKRLAQMKEYREIPEVRERIRTMNQDYAKRRFFYVRSGSPTVSVAPRELASLWKAQRGYCALTGERLTRENAHLDHVVPVARGGVGTVDNLRWITCDANQAKRSLLDSELFDLCRKIIIHNKLL